MPIATPPTQSTPNAQRPWSWLSGRGNASPQATPATPPTPGAGGATPATPATPPTPQSPPVVAPPPSYGGGPPAMNPAGMMPGIQGLMNHFGQMPMAQLPQPWQDRVSQRWATIGGGQPMPGNLSGFFDAAKTYYGANPPIRPEHRGRMIDMLRGFNR